MPITPSDVRKVVTDEDDFGHEMRVGALLQITPAIEFEHGGTYKDEVTGKPRQFDFRCSLRKETALLSLAVECKNLSVEAPLVMSGTWRRKKEAFHDLIESRTGRFEMGSTITVGLSSITRRSQSEDSFYPPKKFVGKSLLRIKTSKNVPVAVPDADIYDRWAQALASAIDLARGACDLSKKFQRAHVFCAVLPIVVVANGALWTVTYDEKGDILGDPTTVSNCELYVGRSITLGQKPIAHRFSFTHVHFFTLDGFDSFLSRMTMNEKAWAKLFNTEASEYR